MRPFMGHSDMFAKVWGRRTPREMAHHDIIKDICNLWTIGPIGRRIILTLMVNDDARSNDSTLDSEIND